MQLLRAVVLFAAMCVPSSAQEAQPKPAGAKVAAPLPVSTQGKAAEAADIVVTVVHAPPAGTKCDKVGCEAPEHWRVELQAGGKSDATPRTFAANATEALKKELLSAAAAKARTTHTDRINVSDAILVMRVPAAAPWSIVVAQLQVAASAGVFRFDFAVVPATKATDAAELRLRVDLPSSCEGAEEVFIEPAEEVRVSLDIDTNTGACVRRFGKKGLLAGAEGDAELRAKLTEAMARQQEPHPVIVTAAPGVPWQAIIGVIDVCYASRAAVVFHRHGD